MKRKRRLRGEGGVCQRASDGLWVGTVTIGREKNGKRKRRAVYGKTQRDVVEKIKAIGAEIGRGGSGEKPTRASLSEFLQGWLADEVAPNREPTTYRSYEGIIEGHINGKHGIGHLKLRDVTPNVISSFDARLRRAGVGDRTRQLTHAVLHRALGHALRQDLIPRNPAALVDAPTYKPTRMKPLTSEETVKFLAAAKGDRLEALYVLAVLSGARQGELFALEWRDFDPAQGTIRIRQSQQDVNGVVKIAPTKTDTSRRQVYLPKIAVETLREHHERAVAQKSPVGPDDRIFTAPEGGPLRRKNVLSRSFKPLLKRAEIPTTTRFHDLRHTYATELLTSGADAKVIQAQLGHSKIGVTLDTYAHLMPSLAKGAVSKLDDAFGVPTR